MPEQIKRIIEDKEGKEHTYLITPFLGRDGMKMLGKLAAIFSELLPEKLDLNDITNNDAGILVDAVLSIGKKSLLLLDDEQISFIQDELFQFTMRDEKLLSKAAEFDFAFQANYGELAKAIIAIIDINYGDNIIKDFFDKLKKTLTKVSGINLDKFKTITQSIKS